MRSNAAHDVDVLHHREATTPNYFLDGTGVGALPNKLPEDRTACPFVWGVVRVKRSQAPVLLSSPTVVRDGGCGNLAGWLIPRALHCLVECGVFGWRIRSAGANTPPVFNA